MEYLESFFEMLSDESKEDLLFLRNHLPVTDWMDYSPTLFLEFAQHAEMLRETMPWCQTISEDFYREYILMPRINDEDLVNIRPLFYSELFPRIKDMTDEEAVLEVNRWCYEKGTYQQADPRTESPKTMYLSGSGRCGEESVFLVTALRSVGIPARQIYTPLWNHCDDNHAWVEAWCGGIWHFLGACEPEPVLDRGWFNAAASRAVLIHSRRFTPAPKEEKEQFSGTSGIVHYYNQTHRYAPTRSVAFTVTDKAGQPVSDATVTLQLLNMACFHPITQMVTKENGCIELDLGEGTFLATAEKDGLYTEVLCSEEGNLSKVLELTEAPRDAEWATHSIHAAKANVVIPTLNEELREKRAFVLNEGAALREARQETFFLESEPNKHPEYEEILWKSGGNWKEIVDFISVDENPTRRKLLESLEPKDYKDVTAAVLNDHLQGEEYEGNFPDSVYTTSILSPRIEWENLTPWRSFFLSALTENEKKEWSASPVVLWNELNQRIKPITSQMYPKVVLSPENCWKFEKADERSLRILYVAILRTLGIPARLRPADGTPEYWKEDAFCSVQKIKLGQLSIKPVSLEVPLVYDQNWSLSIYENGFYHHLNELSAVDESTEKQTYAIPVGEYCMTLSTRLPNGNQECRICTFSLDAETPIHLEAELPTFKLSEILSENPLPEYVARSVKTQEFVENPHKNSSEWNLLCWLEEGSEPTEHVLNELLENQETIERLPLSIYFFIKNDISLEQITLKKVLETFPQISVYTENWAYNLDNMARATYGNAETPPLVILCDQSGNGVYSASGYNVGTIALIAKIVEAEN